jgi:phage baseplate assembly protein V
MMTLSELERRINNICQLGTIVSAYTTQRPNDHLDYALYAKVDIQGRVTDFFPVFSQQGEFKKSYIPPYVGEQVMVFCPNGNASKGYILRGIFDKDSEPIKHNSDDRLTEYHKYKDGTKINVDLKNKIISLDTPNDVKVKTSKTFTFKAKNASLDKKGNLKVKGGIWDKLGYLTKHPHPPR